MEPTAEQVDAAIELLETDILLGELIDLGLIEEMEIDGEPHYRLTDAGAAYAESQVAA